MNQVQGGSNADNVLADAYVKGVGSSGGVNWTEGYLAMVTDAEVTPYNNFDFEDFTQSTKEVSWNPLGNSTSNMSCLSN